MPIPTLAPILVDKLLALDLPERDRTDPAAPVSTRRPRPAPRPRSALRLAGLLADRGDTKAALDVLGKQDDAVLDPALVLPRGLLRASLLVRAGEADMALLLLAGLPGREAVDQRAAILEGRKDWPSAVGALQDFLAGDAFSTLPDRDQRDVILHLARDASEAGDMAALRRLRRARPPVSPPDRVPTCSPCSPPTRYRRFPICRDPKRSLRQCGCCPAIWRPGMAADSGRAGQTKV